MDTDQRRQNNMQTNTFSKGMNTDTVLDNVDSATYVFGQNIRITNNTLIAEAINANTTEGSVTPVEYGKEVTVDIPEGEPDFTKILAVNSIGNVGVLILATQNDWRVFRMNKEIDKITLNKIFISTQPTTKDRFSIVLNQESKDILKVYIADGVHPLMQLNILDDEYIKKIESITDDIYEKEDYLSSNRIFPTEKVFIEKIVSGTLKTSQVQYTYRFYKKHGVVSRLAPVTNKIQIIDPNRNKETGNAENTTTSIGLQLRIPITDPIKTIYDHIQIYRLSYIKAGQNAEIDLISDINFDVTSDSYIFVDSGRKSLSALSIEEFAAIQGQTLVPTVLEQNQGYLFEGNINDQSQILMKDFDIDTEAYSFYYNGLSDSKTILYSDSTYTDYETYTNIEDISSNYYLNKDVDINIETSNQRKCVYKKGSQIYGGSGLNVSWELSYCKVLIHKDYKNIKYPSIVTNFTNVPTYGLDHTTHTDENLYFNEHHISCTSLSYDDPFTSSILRSLRRNEVYRYGIVFYDKYGRRSDVKHIADIKTPSIDDVPMFFSSDDNDLYALPLGLQFQINIPNKIKTKYGIVGYEIVRCEKTHSTSKILDQCVISRPVRQKYGDKSSNDYTPYYPTGFLTTKNLITTGYGHNNHFYNPAECGYDNLYQIFNSNIQFNRNDVSSRLSRSNCKLHPIKYIYGTTLHDIGMFHDNLPLNPYHTLFTTMNTEDKGFQIFYHRFNVEFDKQNKSVQNYVFDYYYDYLNLQYVKHDQFSMDILNMDRTPLNIISTSDTKNPKWNNGFTDIQLTGDKVTNGIKQYKSYITNTNNTQYVNWVVSGMYDLRISDTESSPYVDDDTEKVFTNAGEDGFFIRNTTRFGFIGPGPQCFILTTETPSKINVVQDDFQTLPNNKTVGDDNDEKYIYLGSTLCNITHTAIQFAGLTKEERQYDTYYGFGNYYNISDGISYANVFDGDVYITPCEIVTLFKAYDFNSVQDSLVSTQIINYVPMESTINNCFDYGMNYRNTQSTNLLLEPGSISGITSQERPLHQYNAVYSDNNTSNNIFNAQLLEENKLTLSQRITYSERKENGEYIDSWQTFKPVDYIDADSRYGDITNLLTVKDVLYFWQDTAFGKLSVNERSLVKDENSNAIQLGQGGVLQRTDYIDTKHGMRPEDYAAINAEGGVYWIDMINKAIMGYGGERTVNISDAMNVQNLVNQVRFDLRPTIHYDLQNSELLCKCLESGEQLIFNLKYNIATSVYNRTYDNIADFNNELYGIRFSNLSKAIQYNNLKSDSKGNYLDPVILQFVVNQDPSTTKVFDDQKIVTIKNVKNEMPEYVNNLTFSFETDIDSTDNSVEASSNREGNIQYPIPRTSAEIYGDRLRGKWMKVEITNDNPTEDFAISHIITKFRQSFN